MPILHYTHQATISPRIAQNHNPFGETLAYTDNGTLPAGLSIGPTGLITGTPAPGTAGNYSVTITVTDGNLGSKSIIFPWAVSPAVAVTLPGPQTSGAGQPISPLQIQATDSLGGALSFSDVVNGKDTLPPGLSIVASGKGAGTISGTLSPTADSGSPYTVTITASDGAYSGSTTFAWAVLPFYQFIPVMGDNQAAQVNTAYAIPFEAELVDASGNPVSFPVQVSISAPFNPTGAPDREPSGTFASGSPFSGGVTGPNGLFAVFPSNLPFTANAYAGSFTVVARASIGAGPTAVFHLTNTPPVVPTINLNPPAFDLASQSATFSLSSTIPSGVAKPAYKIDWGDGTPASPDVQIIPFATGGGAGNLINISHTYASAASFTAQYQVIDLSTGGTVVAPSQTTCSISPVTPSSLASALNAAGTAPLVFQITSSIDAVTLLSGLNGLSSGAVTGVQPVTISLDADPAVHFTDLKAAAPANVPLTISSFGGAAGAQALVVGSSPALEIDGGAVTVDGVAFTTATTAPAVLVTGGSLTLRNSTVTATGSSPAAVQVAGGAADLGTALDPGGNLFDSDGPGDLVQNTSGSAIPAVGNTFALNGVALTSDYRIADQVLDGTDAGGAGLVTFVPGSVYVTAKTGSIQPAIDAAPAGTTIHVESAAYPPYDTHGQAVSILFTVSIDPGAYTGAYTIPGQGSFTGPTTLELAPGVYTVDDGGQDGGSSFDFQVDALGNVTSLDPLSARGGLGTLTFRTAAVAIDPGAAAGAYTLSPFGTSVFNGAQTFPLIAGLYYNLDSVSGGVSFTFQLDGDGNVLAVSSTAFTGSGPSLAAVTVPLEVNPGGYTGPYTVGGVTVAGGPATVAVLDGAATPVTVAGQTATVTATDQGETPGGLSFTVSEQSYTFTFTANRPPTASAGGPYTVREGQSLTLNASASSDPDSDPLSYTWDVNGDTVFGDAVGVSPTLTWAQLNALGITDGPATYQVFVQADDGHGHVVTSLPATLVVTNAPPTAGVSGPNAGPVGQALAYTLTASDPSAADQAAGFTYTINWDDGSPAQTVAVSPGNGVDTPVTHAFAAPGSYTVQVTATDKDGGLGTAATLPVVINKAADTLTLSASPAPATYGQMSSFAASVTANDFKLGIPTGTVTFYDGTTMLGSAALVNGGAICPAVALTAGGHAITAVYSGDGTFVTGNGTLAGGQTVEQAGTSVAVTSSSTNDTSTYGQQVTFTATVAAVIPAELAGESVIFKDGSATLGTGTLNASGVATYTSSYTQLAAGSGQAITAVYGGDADYQGDTGTLQGGQTVNPCGTSTSVTSSSANNTSSYGQQVTFTATVTPTVATAGAPAGTVSFYAGSVFLGRGTLSGAGMATLATMALPIGTDTIKAVYDDATDTGATLDGNFTTSNNTLLQTVNAAGPVDVTSQVSIAAGGFVRTGSRLVFTFTQSVTITNTSGSAITGPVSLVLLNLASGVTLTNATGTTTTGGDSYINLVLNNNTLAAGQSVSLTLDFNDPADVSIYQQPNPLFRVLAGAGTR